MTQLKQIAGIPRPGKSSFDTMWLLQQFFKKQKPSIMYDVQVKQRIPVTKFIGADVLALPAGSLVRMTGEVPGVAKLVPSLLLRTDCPAHPFVNLQTGTLLEQLTDDQEFMLVENVEAIVISKAKG